MQSCSTHWRYPSILIKLTIEKGTLLRQTGCKGSYPIQDQLNFDAKGALSLACVMQDVLENLLNLYPEINRVAVLQTSLFLDMPSQPKFQRFVNRAGWSTEIRHLLTQSSKGGGIMQLNIELNEDYELKLAYMQQKTDQKDIKALIEAAIDTYYDQLDPPPKTALQIFQQSGFVGCIQAEVHQSTNYKSIVHGAIEERFNRSQEP